MSQNASAASDRIVRLNEVVTLVGVSRSQVYRLLGTGDFPAPKRLGPRSIGWRYSDIAEWLETREDAGPGARAGGAA